MSRETIQSSSLMQCENRAKLGNGFLHRLGV
jgi:hypothetical protein